MKLCQRCKQDKPCEEFHRQRKSKDGMFPWCKECTYAYFLEHKEHRAAYMREYRMRNPEKHKAYRKRTHANRIAHVRQRKAQLRDAVVPGIRVTAETIDARMQFFGYRCWICGGSFEQVDHVKPVARGGLHIPANLRPACAACNNAKRAKWVTK